MLGGKYMITPLDIENKKFSKQMMNGYSVEEVISKKNNSIVSMETSSTIFDKYVNLEKMLSNNYTINTSEHSSKIYITPKKKPTNQTVVDLIDIFLDVVDNPILKKVS